MAGDFAPRCRARDRRRAEGCGKAHRPPRRGTSKKAWRLVGAAVDALSALANLGFKPAEASAAVNAAQDELGSDASLDALVRLALKKAAK